MSAWWKISARAKFNIKKLQNREPQEQNPILNRWSTAILEGSLPLQHLLPIPKIRHQKNKNLFLMRKIWFCHSYFNTITLNHPPNIHQNIIIQVQIRPEMCHQSKTLEKQLITRLLTISWWHSNLEKLWPVLRIMPLLAYTHNHNLWQLWNSISTNLEPSTRLLR